MQWNISNKHKFFLLTVTSGWGGSFIGSVMGELVLKLTTMTPRSVILLEPCINLLQNF